MAEYLRTRKGNFYLQLRVPADLRSTFPDDTEILKSLRTKDPKTARLTASCLRPHFLEVFTPGAAENAGRTSHRLRHALHDEQD